MIDTLGDRMKQYEASTRYVLPRRSYTIIRVDGKAFHTYTKGLKKPFDDGLINDMNWTAMYLCEKIQNAKFAYVQSDEISILVSDFDTSQTDAWYGNVLQKMCSVSASAATSRFNYLRMQRYFCGPENNVVPENQTKHDVGEHFIAGANTERIHDDIASLVNYMPHKWDYPEFDSRVFQIPQKTEVINYFIWRQQDATRNSIASVAQSLYSHKELKGVDSDEQQELIFQKGINWNDFSPREKRGGFIEKVTETWLRDKGAKNKGRLTTQAELESIDYLHLENLYETYERSRWTDVECPIFTQDKQFLDLRIPDNI